MTEIERVRRFEKMNESSLYKSIKDQDEFNILYILSRNAKSVIFYVLTEQFI